MAKALYKNLGHKLGGFRCVSIDKDEKVIAGRRGEIRTYNKLNGEEWYRAIYPVSGGNEKTKVFSIKYLARWVNRIDVPTRVDDQCLWANNPNRKHDEYGK